jgi:hypothetical protein
MHFNRQRRARVAAAASKAIDQVLMSAVGPKAKCPARRQLGP